MAQRLTLPRHAVAAGDSTFNKDLLSLTVGLAALKIKAVDTKKALTALNGHLLHLKKISSIIPFPLAKQHRILLLKPDITATSIQTLPEPIRKFAIDHKAELITHDMHFAYEYWSVDQVLKSMLPEGMDIPSSYETVGHIAHVNLRDEQLPFKLIIGKVLLDKVRSIRTVVNKLGNIDNVYRFFEMEVIAGEDDLVAELFEGKCKFTFDFSKVYWNSRLQAEHDRIVKFFAKTDLVCDVFAGVGPFAVPAAKSVGCVVFANDLNPSSYKYLQTNIKNNQQSHLIHPLNMDGREIIARSFEFANDPKIIQKMHELSVAKILAWNKRRGETLRIPIREPATFRHFQHYVMNLPGTATDFLDAFNGLYATKKDIVPADQLPVIHVHLFVKGQGDKIESAITVYLLLIV